MYSPHKSAHTHTHANTHTHMGGKRKREKEGGKEREGKRERDVYSCTYLSNCGHCCGDSNHSRYLCNLGIQFCFSDAPWFLRKCPSYQKRTEGRGLLT